MLCDGNLKANPSKASNQEFGYEKAGVAANTNGCIWRRFALDEWDLENSGYVVSPNMIIKVKGKAEVVSQNLTSSLHNSAG